jgi:ABC-type taurine transport system substrate-binding protein
MAPNEPTHEDIIAARERVKTMLPPSFNTAIDRGDLDGFRLFERAMQQLIKERGE